ncbi:regulatory protein RecX [Sinimarinibacterium sp. CAU 1509]|uniref:regulatory protein RecX n=1 Tax=Sinimarinibacterium sp. CAU 1509 TaxID=2562283 RepID=UPI0010AD081B|nr:regulatory protein RecX [Sinimarinibacterium sp. CAU 1509]TJY56633.1 regulatory protein RecX [Sinimarinibacterium sp. CAU 1509]
MPPRKSKELTEQGARDAALRALARREHSAAELAYKLKQRGHADDVAQSVVDAVGEAGWQSDARYAEMLVRNRIEQGYGPLRIRAELQAAGVADTVAREALDAADIDWCERVRAVHQRRFSGPASSAKQWQQQYRFLAGRGFASEHIRMVLKGLSDFD